MTFLIFSCPLQFLFLSYLQVVNFYSFRWSTFLIVLQGTSNSKVKYIKSITRAVLDNDIILSELTDDANDVVYKKLTSLQGLGNWTTNMYLLFVLNRQDILPYDDTAFLQSYCWMYNTKDKSKESIIKKCKKWQPYSSIASRYLYRALDTGLTKEPFKL